MNNYCSFRCIECAGAGIQMLDYLRWLGVITSPILNTLHVVLWPIIGILHDILSLNFPSEHNTKKTGIIWADQWESLLDWHLIALLGVGLWSLARDVVWSLKSLGIYLWHLSITEMHLALSTTRFLVECFRSPFCIDGAKRLRGFVPQFEKLHN